MDNRVFDVNGRTEKQLEVTLTALLLMPHNEFQKVEGFYINPNKGLILVWHKDDKRDIKSFTNLLGMPIKPDIKQLAKSLMSWLETDEAKTIPPRDSWDEDADHDGSNELGWRLYTEEWGHVHEKGDYSLDHYSIAAFKPAYMWYGK